MSNLNITTPIFKTIGKRKCAVANLVGQRGTGRILVNSTPSDNYFQYNSDFLAKIYAPFQLTQISNDYDLVIKVNGGGLHGQANAIQLAISRALATLSLENRSVLKKQGLLTRDSRIKERKKYGLKKARKASQFSKR